MAKDTQPGDPKQDPFVEQPRRFDPASKMMKLQGKDYLPVAARIVWFREDHEIGAGWGITTELVAGGFEKEHATVKASVVDPQGRIVATGYKTEEKGAGGRSGGFPEWVEKAETGAIGRALGICGFGTLQAIEFDEGDNVCDSPQSKSNGTCSGGGPPKCSKCGSPITAGRVTFCMTKKQPLTCTKCGDG